MEATESSLRWRQILLPEPRHALRPAPAPAATDRRPVPVRLWRLVDDPCRDRSRPLGCVVTGHRRTDSAFVRPRHQRDRCSGAAAVVAAAAEAGRRHGAQCAADRPVRAVRAVAAAAGRRPWLAAGDVLRRHAAGRAGHRPVHRRQAGPGPTRWPDDRPACPHRLADLEGAQPDRGQRVVAGLVAGRQRRPRHPGLRAADRPAVRSDAGLVRHWPAVAGRAGRWPATAFTCRAHGRPRRHRWLQADRSRGRSAGSGGAPCGGWRNASRPVQPPPARTAA